MAAPKWFETTTYFNNKLAQMQRDEPEGNWTADSLTAAFEASGYNVNSADSMYTHFEQYGNTVNERVSPNQYFDNDYYMNSKLAQMQTTNPGYTMDQLMTAMFAEGNMSPWTHYTLYGFAEGIDPSAGFNTNDYMAAKLAQMQATDPSYTMDRLFEAFRAGNLNPIEHYFEYGVNENLAYTPVTPTEYNDIALAAGEHEYVGTAGDDNFMASVVSSSSKSTLQNDDSIDGAGGNDMLTVDMGANWNGFSDKGGMTNVETVNLNNSGSRAYTFDATGIEGAQTYNIDGNVNLSNLARAGVAVNLSNVDTSQNIEIGFADGVMSGSNDTLNIGMNNVRASGGITTNGIENIVINATGEASSAPLKYMQGSTHLTITGDGNVSFGNVSATMKNVDMSEATGDNFVCTRRADQIESVKLGQGDDRVSIRSIIPDAAIDGGEGVDTVSLVSTAGAYQFRMNDVETIAINVKNNFADQIPDIGRPNPSESLILDGALTTGLETIKLAGGNGYDLDTGTAIAARPITLVNYDMGELGVDVTGKNNVNLTVTDVEDVVLTVGDGDATTIDSIQGSVTLADARSVAVNVADTAKATFSAALNAANAESLNLSNSQSSTLNVTGGDLSAVSQLKVGGYGDVSVAGNIGTDVGYVNVNAEDLVGGTFTSKFAGNSTSGGATLNFTGSITGKSDITVDGTYKSINITTGINNDTFTLNSTKGDGYTAQNLNVDLGGGSNTAVVYGKVADGSDFSGIKGISSISFESYTAAELAAAGIKVGDGVVAVPYQGGGEVPDYVPADNTVYPVTAEDGKPVQFGSQAPVEDLTLENTTGNTNSYQGQVAEGGSLAISGNTGGVEVNFGDTANDVQTNNSESVVITGGEKANTITGTVESVKNASITTGTKDDTVDLTVAQAAGQSTIINNTAGASGTDFKVNVSGAGETTVTSADFENVIVAAAATGNTTLVAAEGTTTPVAVNVQEGATATVTVQANNADEVALNVNGGEEVVVQGNGNTTLSGSFTSADTTLTLGGEGATFYYDDSGDGNDMSALSSLKVQDGATAVLENIESEASNLTLDASGSLTLSKADFNSVTKLNVKTSDESSSVTVDGKEATGTTGNPKKSDFKAVTELTIDGKGDVVIDSQVGDRDHALTVDASKAEGNITIDNIGLRGSDIICTTGSGDDSIVLAGAGGVSDYNVALGKGADNLSITVGFGAETNGIAKMSIDLGNDDDADNVEFFGESYGEGAKLNSAFVSISNFDYKIDTVKVGYWSESYKSSFDVEAWKSGSSAIGTDAKNFFKAMTGNDLSDTGVAYNSDNNIMIVDGKGYIALLNDDTCQFNGSLNAAAGHVLIEIAGAQASWTLADLGLA